MVNDAICRLVWDEPAEAAAWVAQNQNDLAGAGLYGQLTRRYLERDDADAMDWIARLGGGEGRDEALGEAAAYWAGKEIDFATTAMTLIGDAQKRQQCMFSLYCNLNRTDAPKADRWLATQGLSAEVRQNWKLLGHAPAMLFK